MKPARKRSGVKFDEIKPRHGVEPVLQQIVLDAAYYPSASPGDPPLPKERADRNCTTTGSSFHNAFKKLWGLH